MKRQQNANPWRCTKQIVFTLTILMASFLAASSLVAQPAPKKTYIILKLDDLVQAHGPTPVPARIQRVADFLADKKIKASFGIIGSSLEEDNKAYFDWIKQRAAKGDFEFWLHGYWQRPSSEGLGEFEHGDAAEQVVPLQKTEALAKAKLGLALPAFGVHWSNYTEETEKAVEMVPDIKVWLYGPSKPKYYTRLSLPRFKGLIYGLENPIYNPDSEKFKEGFLQNVGTHSVFVLQGHPNKWDTPARWEAFVKIITFLQEQGCIFITPSDALHLPPGTIR